MHLHRNDHAKPCRRLHGALPHDVRRAAYITKMIERMARVYRRDVEVLDYSFDDFEPIALNARR